MSKKKRYYGIDVSDKETPHNWSYKHDFPIDEILNTDKTLARLIVPRLQAFKQLMLTNQSEVLSKLLKSFLS